MLKVYVQHAVSATFHCLRVCCSISAAQCFVYIASGRLKWMTVRSTWRREFSPAPQGSTSTADFTTWRQLHISFLIYFFLPSLHLFFPLCCGVFFSVLLTFPPSLMRHYELGEHMFKIASEFWQKRTRCYHFLDNAIQLHTHTHTVRRACKAYLTNKVDFDFCNRLINLVLWLNNVTTGWEKHFKKTKGKTVKQFFPLSAQGEDFVDGHLKTIWVSGFSETSHSQLTV